MLILLRSPDETVNIGDDIIVKVFNIYENKYDGRRIVRLGFQVPEDIKIWRGEIYRRLQENNGNML